MNTPTPLNETTSIKQTELEIETPLPETTDPVVEAPVIEPASKAKSQMQILREIENGELSVDEALSQLNP